MSLYRGHVLCPECGKGSFYLENWETYVSVTCRGCGYKMRELDASWFSDYPQWNIEDPK